MKLRLLRLFTALPIAALLLAQSAPTAAPVSASGYSQLTTLQKKLLSGSTSLELNPETTPSARSAQRAGNYVPSSDDGCPVNLGSNIKVNQNCLNITDPALQGRGQAQNETAIAQDPFNPQNVVATYNDYRRGDGNCYGSFSRDGGRTWTDTTIPMGFTRGGSFGAARQYWQAGGDTSIAWDTKGNAYFECQVFMRGLSASNNPDQSSGVYVFRSTRNHGASWNFPGRPAVEQANFTPSIVPLLDKPYMTVDNHVGSPFQDRVYVTWTLFAANGTANIYESHSSDYGETFSAPVLVSPSSTLCPVSVIGTNNCDANQFSDPFTGPDGALYVAFDNFNNAVTGADNRNQILLAKSTDGGVTFSAPTKVADYYDLPDCPTYQGGQDAGRACVPEKGSSTNSVFRATNYASGAVNPEKPSQVAVTVGSYINRYSNESNGCAPAGFSPFGNNDYVGVKTPGACNNKIMLSVSNDGGTTFTGTTTDPRSLATVNTARQAGTDQFWQWAAFSKDGKLAASYYDRQYGNDETTGNMDVSLSGSQDLQDFGVKRATSSSMPLPTEFPNARGNSQFFGDYSGLTAVTDALPLWMDTRSPDLFLCNTPSAPNNPPQLCGLTEPNGLRANDQDIFVARLGIPSGGEDNGDNGGGSGG
jgi:hypothetical protein